MGIRVIEDPRAARIAAADQYLSERVATYEQRCHRFDCTLEAMHGLGLRDTDVVFDIGAGDGHFGVRMHTGVACRPYLLPSRDCVKGCIPRSRARYVPVDACIDGVDLDEWTPLRRADFFVMLEVLEHLHDPSRLLNEVVSRADVGVLISTPNPETTDVLGMDATHVTPITRDMLECQGFHVEVASFYSKPEDSLFAVFSREFV